jgi:outer membrane protein assembly factor BamB
VKKTKSETIANVVALFLMFAIAVSLVALPTANAQGTQKTYAFIGALPNPAGVGQTVLLHVGITQELPGAFLGWEDLSVAIKKPDGTTETISGIRTDATGGTGVTYTPTMTGNYTLQTHFPQQWGNYTWRTGYSEVLYSASDSEELTLVVQQEPIEYYPGHPLPTEYWTRPIDTQLREWGTIAGSWPETSIRNPRVVTDSDGPESAHILWTKPYTIGGLVTGEQSFEMGDAYEGKWSSRLILAGRLYYTLGPYERPAWTYCVDVRTGETLWAKVFLDNQSISFGQLYYWASYNMHGVFEYLWVTVGGGRTGLPASWYAFDAFTGDHKATLHNVPSGTRTVGSKGEFYIYSIDFNAGTMSIWNQSAFISMEGSWGSAFENREYNVSTGYYRTRNMDGSWGSWVGSGADARVSRAWINFTIPTGLPGSVRAIKLWDKVFGLYLDTTHVTTWGLSLKPGDEGRLLFKETWKAPAEWVTGNLTLTFTTADLNENVAVIWVKEKRVHYCFSTETGDLLWGPAEPENYMNGYTRAVELPIFYDGKMYATGASGIVYCYDVKTGTVLWTYETYDPYQEFLFGNNWWQMVFFIAGGKVYLGHIEHSPINPMPRGAPFVCLNATNGEVVWRADGLFRQNCWGGQAILGDNVIATLDTYDQRIYGIGKGPSATTVTASPKVSVEGSNVLVEGMVTDISPGTQEYSKTARFPNGVSAICDANMSAWMLYVYKQFERPADVVGVEVVVSVLDPNNNFYEIGRTTSDASGFFKLVFTPLVPGEYTIIASFEGSGAYYESFAETGINVEEAPEATPEPTAAPVSAADLYLVPGIAGIIVAIAVVGALLMLMLRRR